MLRSAAACALLLCQACDGPGAGPGADLPAPVGWIADPGAGTVDAWDLGTGAPLGPVVDLEDGAQPSAVAAQGDRVLVADFRTGALDAWSDGAPSELHRNGPTGLRLEEPCGLCVERDPVEGDEVLVLANDSWNVGILGADGEERGEVGADPPLVDPHGFDLLPDGRLVVGTSPVTPGLGLVQIWDPATGQRAADFAPYPELSEATSVAVLGGGIVVADWFDGRLVRYSLDGDPLGVLADDLDHPISIVADPSGALWVLTATAVIRVDPDGAETEVVDGSDRFVAPRNLVLAP